MLTMWPWPLTFTRASSRNVVILISRDSVSTESEDCVANVRLSVMAHYVSAFCEAIMSTSNFWIGHWPSPGRPGMWRRLVFGPILYRFPEDCLPRWRNTTNNVNGTQSALARISSCLADVTILISRWWMATNKSFAFNNNAPNNYSPLSSTQPSRITQRR